MNAETDIDIQRVRHLRAEIRRYEAACGCELGTLFAIVSLLAFAMHVGWGQGRWSGWALVWMISWSFTGKLIGLGYARIRAALLQTQLERELRLRSRSRAHRTAAALEH